MTVDKEICFAMRVPDSVKCLRAAQFDAIIKLLDIHQSVKPIA